MEKQQKEMIINGFLFENAKEAEQAKREAEGVKFVRQKIDREDPEAVLKIYNKMVLENLFETSVGHTYLKELQEYLTTIYVDKEQILPIRVRHPLVEESVRERVRGKAKAKPRKPKEINKDYKQKYHIAAFFCGILAVCVVAMFLISGTSDHVTILNYETKLIDKYALWEQELSEREKAVAIKEEALRGGED
ncbi:MAG: hypothetical protein ACI4DR_02375 [Roseburia sp.]